MRCLPLLALGLSWTVSAEMPRTFRNAVLNPAPSATVLLVGKPASLEKAWKEALQHDSLMGLGLRVMPVQSHDSKAAWMGWLSSQGLQAASTWVVVAKDGTILAQGKERPDPATLGDQLAARGVVGPVKALRTFLAAHPDHQEARFELIRFLREVAERRTRAHLGIRLPEKEDASGVTATASEWSGGGLPLLPEDPAMLDAEQDLVIWAATAQEYTRFFQAEHWTLAPLPCGEREEYPAELHSPTMRALYRRFLPTVQDRLREQPSAFGLWKLWLWMVRGSGERPRMTFIQGLAPVPQGRRGLSWPPSEVVMALVADGKGRGDWSLVREVLLPQWELVNAGKAPAPAQAGPSDPEWDRIRGNDADGEWKHVVDPLLEALVRSGDEAKAREVAVAALGWPFLPSPGAKAQALARRLKRPDLIQSWAVAR